jgi:hypothetical protein
LLSELGNADLAEPLTRRYAAVMAQPWDLSGDAGMTRKRSELMLAMNELMEAAQQEFLS